MFLRSSTSSFSNYQGAHTSAEKLCDHKLPVNGGVHLVECVLRAGVTFIAGEEFKRSRNG